MIKSDDDGGDDERGAGEDDSNRSEDEDEGASRALPYVRRTVGLVHEQEHLVSRVVAHLADMLVAWGTDRSLRDARRGRERSLDAT